MKISPSRAAAFDILLRLENERAFSSVLLPIYEEKLSELDRGLCHELVLGLLRKQIYLDRFIEFVSGKKELDIEVRIALRLGAYQILFLDKVPSYSAINESVNLVQKAKKTSAKGFVNAVLRKLTAQVPPIPFEDDVDRISVSTSHPRWLIEKWIADFGSHDAEQIAIANNRIPRPAFRYTAKTSAELAAQTSPSEYVDGCYFVTNIDEDLHRIADSGEIYFQDEGSQLVGQAVVRTLGNAFLDVCAAPGGKTTQIAARMRDVPDRFAVAGDVHRSRVDLLRATCVKQGVEFVDVLQYDAEAGLPFAGESFDSVLVDAPCSGTGTIRHNPEIRYFLSPEDLLQLGSKQLAILENASKVVRHGGRLIYSTCSIQPEENEAVCHAFLTANKDFRAAHPDVPAKFATLDGFARTFPHRDDMDGFFIAAFFRD